jgi:isocitrate lyase
MKHTRSREIERIEQGRKSERWDGVLKPYSAEVVYKLRGSFRIEHSIAKRTSQRLWRLLQEEEYLPALGALTGNQAVQMVQAGLKAIYLSGWQVAADANLAGQTYPDLGLYPSNSGPLLVRRINQAFQRADQIAHAEGKEEKDWFSPIVADCEAGFGGPLNVFELTKSMIEAGAAGVHYEDQLASEKKCGHMGGKVLVPTSQFICTLIAARLAADVMDVPTVIVARTDATNAHLITSDIDQRDRRFITGERTSEGFYRLRGGLEAAVERAVIYAPYADLLWYETSAPDLEDANRFASAIHRAYPNKMLAYNCSPSFNWEMQMSKDAIASFQKDLARMGYKFQFITLAGFHALNYSMFELAKAYATEGMPAYVRLQREEFATESSGYGATKHQKFVGTGYFDQVAEVIAGGQSSTTAMKGSTEEEQFLEKQQIP